MSDQPTVTILLTTYGRTEIARRTIRGLCQNLRWDNMAWFISDDGTPDPTHVRNLKEEILAWRPGSHISVYNSNRRGVGHGMNHSLQFIFENISTLVLVMEDDWELTAPLDLAPYVQLLTKDDAYGLVRFGYLAANLLGYLVSECGLLFWRLEHNGETYRFAGHPSLRHVRFHQVYGYYDEGLAPGMTELSMCGKTNARQGPHIVYPAVCGQWGFFGHIGSESLADISPGGD